MAKSLTFWVRELPGVALTVKNRQWTAHVLESDATCPGRLKGRRVSLGQTAGGEPDPEDVAHLAHQLLGQRHDPCKACQAERAALKAGKALPPLPPPDPPLTANPPLPLPKAKKVILARARMPKRAKAKVPSIKADFDGTPSEELPACPAGDPACALGLMGGECSIPSPLFVVTTEGPPQRQTARFCLIDARKLVPSHLPLNDWQENAAYPKGVQTRRYDRDKAEQLKVIKIAQNLEPEVIFNPSPDGINGPPIVTERGIVLGGNGRSMALQVHYAAGPDKAARKFLIAHAKEYGFTADQVRKIERPVLVRVVKVSDDKPKTLAALVHRYNQPMTQGLDVRASAVAEARQLDAGALQTLADSLPDDETLTAYLASNASKQFLGELRNAGIINQRNSAQLLTGDGLLNDDGRQLVERVLTAAVVTDANLLDDMGAQARAAVARVVPSVVTAAAQAPEWDLRQALAAAARDVVRMKAQGQTHPDEYLRAQGLFADIQPAVTGLPLGAELLHILWDLVATPVKLGRVFQEYAKQSRHSPQGQSGFAFEAAPKLPPRDVLLQAGARQGVEFRGLQAAQAA